MPEPATTIFARSVRLATKLFSIITVFQNRFAPLLIDTLPYILPCEKTRMGIRSAAQPYLVVVL